MISAVRADAFAEPASQLRFTVRKAAMRDIPAILDLINGYAARGVMLPRTEFELSETIRDFSVAILGSRLLGCGALHFYSPSVAEIRSLAVSGEAKTHGVGRKLVEALVGKRSSMNWALSLRLPTLLNFSARWVFNKSSGGCCR
jgi:GNAT superfamily N-acetyltransferase